jgi:PAS domain S-box-containing protein
MSSPHASNPGSNLGLHPPGTAPVKLLVVDDDRHNLVALQAILEPLEQELMLAENGTDALRLCLDHNFAAILLDVRMPIMDGFETAEMIRSRKQSHRTPILFLTAYRSDEQLFRGYDLGAVDFLFKPIVPEILLSKVKVFVELRRSEELLQRQTEDLKRTERKFRDVLEAAPDAMVITSEDGRIELANSRVDTLFQYPRETLIGQSIRTLIPEWERLRAETGLDSSPLELRQTGVRRDGTAFPAGITRSPFHASDSVLVTTAIRDITIQVDAEARIQQTNVELERRVAERTAALSSSNEALRQFTWAASHDLQEPIRTVLTYAQWLSEAVNGRLEEREKGMLTVIEDHAARLNRLLGALRQYVHVSESGQQKWTPVDCNEVVVATVATLQTSIQETGATVEWGELPVVTSIEILLVQIFQNLISNGIKYRSYERAPVIGVSAAASKNGWTFSVADNGIGIEAKYSEYIFGVFRRLHIAEHSGTGIGLSICKAAVERLGGCIWVESTPGSGSVFKFTLPRDPLRESRTP